MVQIKKTDNRSIDCDPKIFLENLGYAIDTDADQPGLWIWTATPSDGCESSFHTAEAALDGAWTDAVAQTLSINSISCEDWGQMDFDAQRVAMTLALTGELPALSDLSPDTQMVWVAKVREVYPDIGSKEAFRLADQEYLGNNGVLSKSIVTESLKGQDRKMNYGYANAIVILSAKQMGLTPPLVAEAKRHLEGGAIHAMTAKAMEDAAVYVNDQLRSDASLISQANACADEIKIQYGFAS